MGGRWPSGRTCGGGSRRLTEFVSARRPREPGRAWTVARGAHDRSIGELSPLGHRAEQETAAAHVAATDEGRRKEQPLSEHLQERLDVPRAGHAAEEDDPTVPGKDPQRLCVPPEGLQIPWLAGLHRDLAVPAEPIYRHGLCGVAKPLARRDDECLAEARGRVPESLRIGELAPEIKRAHETVDLAERDARLGAQAYRQREGRAIVQEQRSSLPCGRGRRQQEDRVSGPILAVAIIRSDLEASGVRPHPFEAVEAFCPSRPLEALRGRADGNFGHAFATDPIAIPA